MFQKALNLDYFHEIQYPDTPEPKYDNMKAHIEHIESIIHQAKIQIVDFKKMTHQLKMELIILREKLLFETDDMPQDSQILLTNFKKISKKKNNMFEKETYICFKELESIIYDNLKIQEEIVMAKNKMEILENTTGSYGL